MLLPEFWQFLQFGWWILHILAVVIIYFLGVGPVSYTHLTLPTSDLV